MERLARISPERIADELRQMLTPPTRAAAWAMLGDRGFDAILFRFVKVTWPVPQHSPSRIAPLFEAVRPADTISFGLALAAATLDWMRCVKPPDIDLADALHPLSMPQIARALRQALKISNDELDELSGALEGVQVLLDKSSHGVARLKRFLARPTAQSSRDLLAVVRPDTELERSFTELARTEFAPLPLLNGDDLTAAGLTPGPVFKRVLDAVYDAQLEGRVTTKGDALAMGLALAR